MPFKPILSLGDLPDTLVSQESLFLDFKSQQAPKPDFEKAKDVAAFANAQGGTILVGAEEDSSRKRLSHYKGIPEPLAAEVAHAYDQSVRDRCRPAPVTETKILKKEDGVLVVAVNVWPFPGQPVGVKCTDHSYAFPMRSGAETVYLLPDQLPMLTLPAIRRVAILLDSIPESERANILLKSKQRNDRGYEDRNVRLESSVVDAVMRNSVVFTDLKHGQKILVPASILEHIWCDTEGYWIIAVPAVLTRASDGVMCATPVD